MFSQPKERRRRTTDFDVKEPRRLPCFSSLTAFYLYTVVVVKALLRLLSMVLVGGEWRRKVGQLGVWIIFYFSISLLSPQPLHWLDQHHCRNVPTRSVLPIKCTWKSLASGWTKISTRTRGRVNPEWNERGHSLWHDNLMALCFSAVFTIEIGRINQMPILWIFFLYICEMSSPMFVNRTVNSYLLWVQRRETVLLVLSFPPLWRSTYSFSNQPMVACKSRELTGGGAIKGKPLSISGRRITLTMPYFFHVSLHLSFAPSPPPFVDK